MDYPGYFLKAITVFKTANNLAYKNLISEFEKQNIPEPFGLYCFLFIPLTFSRIICKQFNINFSDEYEIHFGNNGETMKGKFSENNFYNSILKSAEEYIPASADKDFLLMIAQRSPEFEIVNSFFLKNEDVSNIVFSSVHFVI